MLFLFSVLNYLLTFFKKKILLEEDLSLLLWTAPYVCTHVSSFHTSNIGASKFLILAV